MPSRVLTALKRYPLPALTALALVVGAILQYGLQNSRAATATLVVALVVAGTPTVLRTGLGLLHGRFASDVVASMAIVGAGLTQEFFAGCVIVLMQTGGEALEDYAVRRASASLEHLLQRAPKLAHRQTRKGLEDVPVEDVHVGDTLVVRPGELIPVDVAVVKGSSSVDESALTGEPVPVSAHEGSQLMSGSICMDGALEVRALRRSSESEYEQIVRLVEQAQHDKPPIARLADRYAIIFTPVTLLVCGLAYVLTRSPQAVVAVLVVATPCPLILATPVAVISGIGRAAGRGIIVKHGSAIELVGQAKAVAFDKTGTLTQGQPSVKRVVQLDGWPTEEILRLAGGLEQRSSHPMAGALVERAREAGADLPEPEMLQETAGQGVTGTVDGHRVAVGSVAYAAGQGIAGAGTVEEARRTSGAAQSAVAVVGLDRTLAGLIVFDDQVRSDASSLIRRLKALGVRETTMLTGDNREAARAIAAGAGIDHFEAELLPGQKVDAVRSLTRRIGHVVMVGDGINDAPALAAATVGIALGARGTAVASEAADIVLTTDDLERVADAIAIGQRTVAIAKQSIWIGLGVSGALMVVAAFGYIPPVMGALLQESLDIGVILNALRARS